jgi:nucleoside-triphosphatase THEP1
VKERSTIPWQKEKIEASTDRIIGQFTYDAEAFQKAQAWLDDHLDEDAVRYLILDEVGPLELSGNGWDVWLKSAFEKMADKTLILVVRETLVDEVVAHYGIEGCEVVGKEYFVN